jgi:thiamine biosynthesis lipoprotein
MRLDLGGIGMGYAVDEAMQELKQRGIDRALIDASGDILASDPPPGERGWKIGIGALDPKSPPSRHVLLINQAISTAGDAYQYVEIGGQRYSHIVDPKTGLGLRQSSVVTVVAPDCMTADSLDTAVSVLGPQRGLQFIDATPGAAGIIVQLEGDPGRERTYESTRFGALRLEIVRP